MWASSCGWIIRAFMALEMPFATGRIRKGTRLGSWPKISLSKSGVIADPSAWLVTAG